MKNLVLKLTGLLSITLAAALFAPQRAAADQDDPPGRVARLSYVHGAVSFEPAGTEDWVTAVVNRPMTTGDKLWSDNRSRGELHIGTAAIRLSGNTGFSFLNLTDNAVQLQLTAGTLYVRVRRLADDETFEVDTPNLAFSILRPGRYRINVNEAGDSTMIVVRDGQAEVTGGGSAYPIRPHEVATFTGTDQLDADVQRYGDEEDDFDRWCNGRDRRWEHSMSARYVSEDVVGYEDLDDHGDWRAVPGYGTVWFPHVSVMGWAPYRYGHWAWISPWGWTWVDDEPWGFAPFHYGRWVFVNGYWGWVPCPPRPAEVDVAYVRPLYAPALVAWVGGTNGDGGGVAWFPLGPREVYVPSYHVSQTYVTNVNITNTTVNNTYVTNVYNTTVVNKNVYVSNITYANQGVAGAVTATSQAAFTSAQPVAKNIVKVDQKAIVSAPVGTAATPAIAPPKEAVLGAGGKATAAPPVTLQSRAVVAKTAPPPPPAPFERQQEAIKANGGKPIAISQVRQLQAENVKPAAPVKIVPPAGTIGPQKISNRTEQPDHALYPPPPRKGLQPGGVQPVQGSNPNNQPTDPRNVINNRPEQQQNADHPAGPGNVAQPGGAQPGQLSNPCPPDAPCGRRELPNSSRNSNNQPTNSRNTMNNREVQQQKAGSPATAGNATQPGVVQPAQGNNPNNRAEQEQSANHPGTPGNVERPKGLQPVQGNNPSNQPTNVNSRVQNDRPLSAQPSNAGGANVNPQAGQKHEQADRPSNANGANVINAQPEPKHEQENSRKQDLERQNQQQVKPAQQQRTEERKPQEIQVKQQQQPQNTERRPEVQQQNAQQKPQQDRPKAQDQSKPPKQGTDKDKGKDKDKPHGQ